MKRILTLIFSIITMVTGARGEDFFSASGAESLFTLGVRAGVNTSNRTITNTSLGWYNFQSWGTGFTVGAIADLNIRDFLSIEPGIFLESRSGHSSFVSEIFTSAGTGESYYITQEAHRHSYNLTIPVLASIRFNITGRLRWHIDAGPYLAFVLKDKLDNKMLVSTRPDLDNAAPFSADVAPVDFGLKFGTALELTRHLYFGIHYEAGLKNAYKNENLGNNLFQAYGGRTKAWNFTLGWNF